jgi:hypothetical protein
MQVQVMEDSISPDPVERGIRERKALAVGSGEVDDDLVGPSTLARLVKIAM